MECPILQLELVFRGSSRKTKNRGEPTSIGVRNVRLTETGPAAMVNRVCEDVIYDATVAPNV